ncbi:MAG: hypothetical protein ABSE77_22880, partial [Acidimicrobiales bacterium]
GKDRTDDLQRATTGPVKGYKALWTYLAGPSACFRPRLIAQVLDGQLILAQFVAVSSDAPAVGNCDV